MKPVVADYRYRVICLRIVPKVGSSIYLTHFPRDLTMNGHTYLSASGYDFTGYTATATMSPAMIDLEGIAGLSGIGYDQVNSGLFDGARAYLFATTWNNPVEDEEPIVASLLGKTILMDSRYKIEEMSLVDAIGQTVGQTYSAQCPKTFGGQEYGGCKVDLAANGNTVSGTLTGVTDSYSFADSGRAEAADVFGGGTIQFTSGPNAGLKPLEIKSFSGGAFVTFEPFYYLPVVGDTYTAIRGCRKRLSDCQARAGGSNVVNFGGFPWIPAGSTYAHIGQR